MIRKYVFGEPFDTEAVVSEIPAETGNLPDGYFEETETEDGHAFSCDLGEKDRLYGLGENVRGINKRGWIYEANCMDDPGHTESKRSLYGAHNFLIVDGKQRFGIFVDAAQKVTFDCGYTKRDKLTVTVSEGGFVLYLLEAQSLRELVREFRSMIGRSYIPPKWAFGYGQSRWGYKCADDIRRVVKEHREKRIPLDAVYMDIDYMERFKDFTVHKERFPDFPAFAEEMKAQHIHLVPIIDAGVKIEEGYPVYEEGVRNGYFCQNEDGTYFVAGVWPGRVHFPDVLNPEARRWFGNWYRVLVEAGIEGFWNDMNEPAIFYSEEYVKKILEKHMPYQTDDEDTQMRKLFELKDLALGLANRRADYRLFYHQCRGQRVRHDRVHNLYGYNMTRAAGEAFERISPDKRILLFSRSSYVGMHRYGGIWMGDNSSWWSHILLNLQMLPSLNMCGFLYTGADLGGFGDDTTEDLMLRWLELGIFTPLMRNHSAIGTREQEFYRFENTDAFRRVIGLRYALLPYLYSEFMKAALTDDLMFMPLAFVYPEDAFAPQAEDQLMVGSGLMIAPVYRQNADGRYVYLPEEMKLYRMRGRDSFETEVLPAGHHYVKAALDEVLVFLRPDHLVPLSDGGCFTDEVDASHLRLLHYIKTSASYELYDDDGLSRDVALAGHLTTITADADGNIRTSGASAPECELI